MRITVQVLNTGSPIVRDLLAKAKAAASLGEAAHYNRLATKASQGSAARA